VVNFLEWIVLAAAVLGVGITWDVIFGGGHICKQLADE
jgi:hypothetical protein